VKNIVLFAGSMYEREGLTFLSVIGVIGKGLVYRLLRKGRVMFVKISLISQSYMFGYGILNTYFLH